METKENMVIDGENVSKNALIYAYRFYKKYHIHGTEQDCPLCGCNLSDNEKFICKVCGLVKNNEEKCTEHNSGYDDICYECCETCKEISLYEDYLDRQFIEYKERLMEERSNYKK